MDVEGAVVEIIIIMELWIGLRGKSQAPPAPATEMMRVGGGAGSLPRPAPWGGVAEAAAAAAHGADIPASAAGTPPPACRRRCLDKGMDRYDDGSLYINFANVAELQTDRTNYWQSFIRLSCQSQSHVAGLTVVTGNWLFVSLVVIVETSSSYSYSSSSTMIRSV